VTIHLAAIIQRSPSPRVTREDWKFKELDGILDKRFARHRPRDNLDYLARYSRVWAASNDNWYSIELPGNASERVQAFDNFATQKTMHRSISLARFGLAQAWEQTAI